MTPSGPNCAHCSSPHHQGDYSQTRASGPKLCPNIAPTRISIVDNSNFTMLTICFESQPARDTRRRHGETCRSKSAGARSQVSVNTHQYFVHAAVSNNKTSTPACSWLQPQTSQTRASAGSAVSISLRVPHSTHTNVAVLTGSPLGSTSPTKSAINVERNVKAES